MGIFSILATPLGIAMKYLYMLIQNYGWTIIVFTILARVLMFPLSLKQQKSTARMSAYQPMLQEIQKKWANDKNRQNQEVQKFYEENNIKMSAGCMPMLVNMLVLFGMIAVIQAPLNYILQVPEDQISNGVAIVQHLDESRNEEDKRNLDGSSNSYTRQSVLISEIKSNPEVFVTGIEAKDAEGKTYHASIDKANVDNIVGFNFEFATLDLARAPKMQLDKYLIMPILSLLTMVGSQFITMRTTPNTGQGRGQMWMMTIVMGAMFGFYAFTVPVGFSLYYTVSNVVMAAQQFVLRRIYDPNKIRAEIEAEIEERKAAKKAKKKVVVRDDEGEVVSLDVSESELVKMRLAKARELDAKKYGDDDSEADKEAAEKARKLDEEKYGKQAESSKADGEETEADTAEKPDSQGDEKDEENTSENAKENSQENAGEKKADYKPGRRKRSRQNKEKEEEAFAQREMKEEQKSEDSETKEDTENA